MVTSITANAQNTFTPEQLTVKGLGELRSIAALAVNPQEMKNSQIVANYGGQGDVVSLTDKETGLAVPVLNFESEQAKRTG